MARIDDIEIKPEDLRSLYRKGYISAGDVNRGLRKLATMEVKESLAESGVFMTLLGQTLKHAQGAWDGYIELIREQSEKATKGERGSLGDIAKTVGIPIWQTILFASAPFTAIGEVSGQTAENLALKAGASPGLAKTINIVVDLGTGIVPFGGAVKSFARGVQEVGGVVKGVKAARAAKKAEKVAEAAAARAGETVETVAQELPQAVKKAIAEGLKTEGIEEANKVVGLAAEAGPEAIESLSATERFQKLATSYKSALEQQARGMIRGHQEAEAAAEKLGMTIEDIRRAVPGTVLKQEEALAWAKTLEPMADEFLTDLRRVGDWDSIRPDHLDGLLQKLSNVVDDLPKVIAAEKEAGRSVEILKERPKFFREIHDALLSMAPEAMANGNAREAQIELLQRLASLDKEKMAALALQSQQPGFWAKFREFYVNTLLAAPISQVRNIIGNTFSTVNGAVERELAGWLSLDKSKGVVRGEGWQQFQGYMAGLRESLPALRKVINEMPEDVEGKLEFAQRAIGGTAGKVIRTPGRALLVMDEIFKGVNMRGRIWALAFEEAKHKGLEGAEFTNYVANRVKNPTRRMLDDAAAFADEATFTNPLGPTMDKAREAIQSTAFLYFPFMRTPINLAKYALARTPGLNLISKRLYSDILAGGTRADEAVARLTMSMMWGSLFTKLGQEGVITGGGPTDPGLRRTWLLTHQPYSIRIGDRWYSYANVEPFSTILSLVGDYSEIMNQLPDAEATEALSAIGIAVSRDVLSKSYWNAFSDIVEAVSGLQEGGDVVLQRLTKLGIKPIETVATGGPLVQRIARINDPIYRETRGVIDEFMSRVPGFSSELPPRRDALGRPVEVPRTLGGQWLSVINPISYREQDPDPLAQTLGRLEVKGPRFEWSIGGKVDEDFDIERPRPGDRLGVPISPRQRDRWQELYGKLINHREEGLSAILNDAEFKGLPPAAQRLEVEKALREYKRGAKEMLIEEDQELKRKVLEADAIRLLPLVPAEEREQVEAEVEADIGEILRAGAEVETSFEGNLLPENQPPESGL